MEEEPKDVYDLEKVPLEEVNNPENTIVGTYGVDEFDF